jgi:hypothetical protein
MRELSPVPRWSLCSCIDNYKMPGSSRLRAAIRYFFKNIEMKMRFDRISTDELFSLKTSFKFAMIYQRDMDINARGLKRCSL